MFIEAEFDDKDIVVKFYKPGTKENYSAIYHPAHLHNGRTTIIPNPTL